MCLATTGKVVELKEKDAVVDIEGKKTHARINPSISVKKGDKVIIFKNIILEKITE
ncbi:MAG: HypC/HybG/HupF family hydrogenase formation chaperone [Candidatus Aenigmarchaeota archaeon]|nr:HypC/HybG/HupF family hydrogenase formation chaperone [Candidatus Aenigmarchaeota archaeon]